jgi:enoyl-CoA hydratase/carnithine racemase
MTTELGTIHFERRGSTAFITFDRPSARNAMTWAMYEKLDRALDRLGSEKDLRVAVLRGAGGHFAAGTDIAQFAAFKSAEDGAAYERQLEAVVTKLDSTRVVTIAAVEGYAAGSGLAIAAACDLRICTPDARFGVPIAKTLGNCLSMPNYARLVASLGAARTKALLLTADFMSAEEARTLGFVVAVVDPHKFSSQVDALCARIATLAPITLQVTKDAVRRIIAAASAEGEDLVLRAYASTDFHEGVSAFLEKRSPNWEGR